MSKTETFDTKNIITDDLWKLAKQELNSLEGWNFEMDSGKIIIHSKMLYREELDFPAYKMQFTVDRPLDLCVKSYIDHPSRPKYLDNVAKASFVHQGENYDIIYQISHPAMIFFTARDLLLCRAYNHFEKGCEIVTKSTTHNDFPVAEYVRSDYYLQAFLMKENKEDPNKTDVILIHQMKMSSWFPNWMCNYAMKHFSSRIMKQIDQACEYELSKTKQ
jgi:hypothetical protein